MPLLSLAAKASLAASAVVLMPAGALIFLLAVCAAALKLLLVLNDIMVLCSFNGYQFLMTSMVRIMSWRVVFTTSTLFW
jgi:hypothetical protein